MTTGNSNGNHAKDGVIRLLIADDHPVVRQGLRAMIKARDIQIVGEAATGVEALELARELTPNVVLIDIRMPEMDGLAATKQIKREIPGTNVLIMSSFESKDYFRSVLEAGGAGYLLKGMARDALIQAIRLVSNGGYTFDGDIVAEVLSESNADASLLRNGTDRAIDSLSVREADVLKHIVNGLTNKQIAEQMSYSVGTVKNTVRRIIQKLDVSDRTQAAVLGARAELDKA